MVVSSGLKEFAAHQGNADISTDEMQASERALERAIAVKTAELKRGLAGLATVGSTAPFVGLFGTVVGIIGAFQALKTNENAGIGAVGGAIAEALIATAFGILVAVPAVWLFNYFTNKVTSFAVEMENSASELVDYFIRQRGKSLRG
jgi:biopolymer transport protein ExbB/biopolymer transport protein TolQ